MRGMRGEGGQGRGSMWGISRMRRQSMVYKRECVGYKTGCGKVECGQGGRGSGQGVSEVGPGVEGKEKNKGKLSFQNSRQSIPASTVIPPISNLLIPWPTTQYLPPYCRLFYLQIPCCSR